MESYAEWFQKISKAKTKQEKVRILREEHNYDKEFLVNLCFNPSVKWRIPEGDVPRGDGLFKPSEKALDLQSVLPSNMRLFNLFVESPHYQNVTKTHVERKYLDFLNSLDPDDAELIISIRNRKFPYRGLTRKLFEDAWPALASTWQS